MKRWMKTTIGATLGAALLLGGTGYWASYQPGMLFAYAGMSKQTPDVVQTYVSKQQFAFEMPTKTNDPQFEMIRQLFHQATLKTQSKVNYEKKQLEVEFIFTFAESELLKTYSEAASAILDETRSLPIVMRMDQDAIYLKLPTPLLKEKKETWVTIQKNELAAMQADAGKLFDAYADLIFKQNERFIDQKTQREMAKDLSNIMIDSISGDYTDVASSSEYFRTVKVMANGNDSMRALTNDIAFKTLPMVIDLLLTKQEYLDALMQSTKKTLDQQTDFVKQISGMSAEGNTLDTNDETIPELPDFDSINVMNIFAQHAVNHLEGKSFEPVDPSTSKASEAELKQNVIRALTLLKELINKPESKTNVSNALNEMFSEMSMDHVSYEMDMNIWGQVKNHSLDLDVTIKPTGKEFIEDSKVSIQMDMQNAYNEEFSFEKPINSLSLLSLAAAVAGQTDSGLIDMQKIEDAVLKTQEKMLMQSLNP